MSILQFNPYADKQNDDKKHDLMSDFLFRKYQENVINQNKMLSLHNCVNHHIILYDYLLMSDKNMDEDDETFLFEFLDNYDEESMKNDILNKNQSSQMPP